MRVNRFGIALFVGLMSACSSGGGGSSGGGTSTAAAIPSASVKCGASDCVAGASPVTLGPLSSSDTWTYFLSGYSGAKTAVATINAEIASLNEVMRANAVATCEDIPASYTGSYGGGNTFSITSNSTTIVWGGSTIGFDHDVTITDGTAGWLFLAIKCGTPTIVFVQLGSLSSEYKYEFIYSLDKMTGANTLAMARTYDTTGTSNDFKNMMYFNTPDGTDFTFTYLYDSTTTTQQAFTVKTKVNSGIAVAAEYAVLMGAGSSLDGVNWGAHSMTAGRGCVSGFLGVSPIIEESASSTNLCVGSNSSLKLALVPDTNMSLWGGNWTSADLTSLSLPGAP